MSIVNYAQKFKKKVEAFIVQIYSYPLNFLNTSRRDKCWVT